MLETINFSIEYSVGPSTTDFVGDYVAEVGMTWSEWVNSEDNTIGAYVADWSDDILVDGSGGTYFFALNEDPTLVRASDVIISDGQYIMYQ